MVSETAVYRLKSVLKSFKVDVLYRYFRKFCRILYMRRVAVICKKDLQSLHPMDGVMERSGVKLIEITLEKLKNDEDKNESLVYLNDIRKKQAIKNIKKGYNGFALTKGSKVIGDMWFIGLSKKTKKMAHPDFKFLNFGITDTEAYAFSMFLIPQNRGHNFANMLQNGVLHEIKKRGYEKALGYYWSKNIPALWVHRSLKWKEVHKIDVLRFFGIYLSRVY